MAYVKNTWVDQAGQVRYTETTDDGYKIFTPNYENVTEIGTPVNAVNMNHIEDGISGVAIRKHNLTETFNLDEIVLGTANGKQNFYCSKTANNTNNVLTDSTKWKLARLGAARNYGEIVTSSLPITDPTLHLADGSLLSSTNYPEFVSFIASLYTPPTETIYYAWSNTSPTSGRKEYYYTLSSTPQAEDALYEYDGLNMTLSNYAVDIYHSHQNFISIHYSIYGDDYYRSSGNDVIIQTFSKNYFISEADWQTSYTTYGECGKYVYDSTNNTVRIPLYNSYFTNTVNPQKLGDLTEASLPNVKGAFNHETTNGTATGAFSIGSSIAGKNASPGGDDDHLIEFNAGNYNSIYKDSATTVNTQSIKQLVYIVVAK